MNTCGATPQGVDLVNEILAAA
jgi:hypothetical protein